MPQHYPAAPPKTAGNQEIAPNRLKIRVLGQKTQKMMKVRHFSAFPGWGIRLGMFGVKLPVGKTFNKPTAPVADNGGRSRPRTAPRLPRKTATPPETDTSRKPDTSRRTGERGWRLESGAVGNLPAA